MAAGTCWINMGILFTIRKLPSIHSESVPMSRSKASTHSYNKKKFSSLINSLFSFTRNRLTHYQTTNFRLFQTERVCRQQFQIWPKWKKVIQTGRKHCEKRRNCSLRAISSFPTVFSKGFFPRGVKRCYCGNGLNQAFCMDFSKELLQKY